MLTAIQNLWHLAKAPCIDAAFSLQMIASTVRNGMTAAIPSQESYRTMNAPSSTHSDFYSCSDFTALSEIV